MREGIMNMSAQKPPRTLDLRNHGFKNPILNKD
jgi:hypothetical protein